MDLLKNDSKQHNKNKEWFTFLKIYIYNRLSHSKGRYESIAITVKFLHMFHVNILKITLFWLPKP